LRLIEGAGEAVHVVGGDHHHRLGPHEAEQLEQLGVDAHLGAVEVWAAGQEVVAEAPVELDPHLVDDLAGGQKALHPFVGQAPFAVKNSGQAGFEPGVQRMGSTAPDGNPERVAGEHARPVTEDHPVPQRHLFHAVPWKGRCDIICRSRVPVSRVSSAGSSVASSQARPQGSARHVTAR